MKIDFPKEEWNKLKKELERGVEQSSTRVSKECGKYKVGDIPKTPWGDKIEVIRSKFYDSFKDHPYIDELNNKQKSEIIKYTKNNKYQVIWFEKVK